MTIHIVVGPPAAGKSTFVEMNAASGDPRWDADAVASVIAGQDLSHSQSERVQAVMSVLRRSVVGWLLDPDDGPVGDFWFIATYPSATLVDGAARNGAEFHLIDPGLDECLARAERDGRPAGTAERIRAWYDNPPVLPGDNLKGADMRFKKFAADLSMKAADVPVEEAESGDTSGALEGKISAYASVFDVVDSYGDVMVRGAFEGSLNEWAESGKTIPVLYGHNSADPFMNIGGVSEAVEDERGLRVDIDLDMDNPAAVQVARLVKSGRLSELSFGFFYRDAAYAERDGQEVYEVRAVELIEVSIVPVGANRETEILSAKSAAELLTAVKQANLDPATAAAVVAALKGADAPAGPVPPTSSESSEDPNESRAALLLARLAISERENF